MSGTDCSFWRNLCIFCNCLRKMQYFWTVTELALLFLMGFKGAWKAPFIWGAWKGNDVQASILRKAVTF